MQFNPAPKTEFQSTPKNLEDHHVIVQNPAVRKGVEVALAQMQRMIADTTQPDMGACAAAHLRVLGAHDFIQTFYQLAEMPDLSVKAPVGNLPGNIRNLNQPSKKN
jgi:hypothetical protein